MHLTYLIESSKRISPNDARRQTIIVQTLRKQRIDTRSIIQPYEGARLHVKSRAT